MALILSGTLASLGSAAGERVLQFAGAAVAFAVLAMVRFELFVLAVLVVRSALDSAKGGGFVEPTTALGAAFLLFVLMYEGLQRLAGAGRRLLNAPFRLPLQIFLAASVVSALGSDDVGASLNETVRLAGAVAMIVALERSMSVPGAARRVLIAFFLSALVPMAFAAEQLLRGSGRLIGDFTRVSGTFAHPNPFSIYLAIVIVMAVAMVPRVAGWVRWVLVGGALVASGCLLLTYTRGSWIALLVGLLVVGALQSRTLIGIVVGGALVLSLLVPSVTARFADLETETRYSGAAGNSFIWRVDYWREIVELSEGSPVTGIGLKGIARSTDAGKNAHNDLIRVYVETGLAGLAAYLALAASLVVTARRALRTARAGWARGVAVGFAGVLAVLGVVSVSSNVITQVVLLWYAVALAMAAVAVAQRPWDVTPGADPVPMPMPQDVDRRMTTTAKDG
jgi:O-antigen ligase